VGLPPSAACGIFEHFPRFEFFLLPNRIHARPHAGNASRWAAFQEIRTKFRTFLNLLIASQEKSMSTSNFPTATTGWIAIVTGVSAILAVVFLTLMYTVNGPIFGTVNDVFNSIIGISSVVLAWMLYSAYHVKSPLVSLIALALAVIGAIFTIIGSILIIFGFKGFVLAGWYSTIGYALIGFWLAGFCYAFLRGDTLPHNLAIFGIVVGAFMATGLLGIPGILARIDSMESMPWYLYVAFLGWLGTYILYPIWTIWMGRNLLLK
jgi:hypothetical protein